jgi:2-polyprenyl-3-methyl-5-hydroxy-6-metoxy-1,4-benzoquinol methylase
MGYPRAPMSAPATAPVQQTLPPNQCAICGAPISKVGMRAIDRLVTGEGPFDVLHCANCNAGSTQPRLTDEQLAQYYQAAYYEAFCGWVEGRGRSPLRVARDKWRAWTTRRRARRCPFWPVPVEGRGRVLDVGCGDGSLLQSYADAGYEAVGVDPSETAVEAVRRRGIEAHHGTLDDHPWEPGSFQAITFQHALEHIPDPMGSLREASNLLAPSGVLIVAVPNWACWQRRLFGSRWSHLELPRHQQHFSPKGLRRAAELVGLQPEKVGTESNVISPAYSLHYVMGGRWTEGWKLWASYALGALVFPLFWLVDRVLGGDCCYLVARRAPA